MKINILKKIVFSACIVSQGTMVRSMDNMRLKLAVADLSALTVLRLEVEGTVGDDPLYPPTEADDAYEARKRLRLQEGLYLYNYSQEERDQAEIERGRLREEFRNKRRK